MKLYCDTFPARLPRGAGRFGPARMQYFVEMALGELGGADLMVTLGTKAPVAFFAYPDKPGSLVPEGCALLPLGGPEIDAPAALHDLAEALGAPETGPVAGSAVPPAPTGALSATDVGASLARHMPEAPSSPTTG